jgi:putative membrane protein
MRIPDPASLQKVSKRHVARAAIRDAILPLAVILTASIVRAEALLALPLVPLLLAGAFLRRRFHRYALTGDTLYVRDGILRQRLWIVPVGSTQALRLSRSLLQRSLGLATIAVDTAGAPAFGGPRIVDLRLDDARSLVDDLAAGVRAPGYRPQEAERA